MEEIKEVYEVMEWITILAIILGPILAVQVQKFVEHKKEQKLIKLQIFKSLMATRATPLYPLHIEALNMIDIGFYKDSKVVDAWKLLLDNFSNYPQDPNASDYGTKLSACAEKSNDLLTDLLYEISRVLGYSFDKVLIKRGCYIPKGHGDLQLEQEYLRKGLLEVLYGNRSIPISVSNLNQNKQELSAEESVI